MKNKSSLALIELCIMLLVLALASALCLRIFAWAEQRAKENAARDLALVQMQSVAEKIKAAGNIEEVTKTMETTWDGNSWRIDGEDYEIRIMPMEDQEENLGCAYLEAIYRDAVLASFSVSWQEVA